MKDIIRRILFVKPKEPLKPVTQEELDQLELEAKKQELLSRISKAKAEQQKNKPSIFNTIQKVIGKSDNNPFDVSSARGKRSEYSPFRW